MAQKKSEKPRKVKISKSESKFYESLKVRQEQKQYGGRRHR